MAIKKLILSGLLSFILISGATACSGGGSSASESSDNSDIVNGLDSSISATTLNSLISNYVDIVSANYTETRDLAAEMQTAISNFLNDPTEANLEIARNAWILAREPYGQTEVYRFYNGPIDNESDANNPGPESRLNSWPLDELVIDYGIDPQNGERVERGVIFDANFEITKENLSGRNGVDGNGGEDEAFIYTGYHAIEFLLWGQDRNGADDNDIDNDNDRVEIIRDRFEAGIRPATDYTANADPNHPNSRRRQYLQVVTELLIDDLNILVDAWTEDTEGNYRESFLSVTPAEALRRISKGFGELSGGELAGERINVALSDVGTQEDEHSCFSDNTHRDIANNFAGIANVYRGTYTKQDNTQVGSGIGLKDIYAAVNPDLNQEILNQISEIESAIDDVSNEAENNNRPFDILIDSGENNNGRDAIRSIVNKLTNQITGGENLENGLVENFSEIIAEAGVDIEFQLEGE